MIEIIFTVALAQASLESTAAQEAPIPIQFFEVRIAEPSDSIQGWYSKWTPFLEWQNDKCFEAPFATPQVMMVASLCDEALNIEDGEMYEVIPLTQEEYCTRSVEIGALPFHEAESWAACELSRDSIK